MSGDETLEQRQDRKLTEKSTWYKGWTKKKGRGGRARDMEQEKVTTTEQERADHVVEVSGIARAYVRTQGIEMGPQEIQDQCLQPSTKSDSREKRRREVVATLF